MKKNTTRRLHLVFAFFSLVGLLANSKVALAHGGDSLNLSVVTISEDTIALRQLIAADRQNVVVLLNNYNCTGCIESVSQLLDSLSSDSAYNVIFICRVGTSVYSRREYMDRVKRKVPKAIVVFDIQSGGDSYPPTNITNGVFGYYKTSRTPELLLWRKSVEQHISYSVLFDGMSVSDTALKSILAN